ncbi:MAG: dihydrodipicolinate synthase family protein [Pseudomonadota bacterium]
MTTYERSEGLWLPLATPFSGGRLDVISLRRMIHHYSNTDISGFILAATTGEGQLLSSEESELLVKTSANELLALGSRQKLYLGISGSDPVKLIEETSRTADWPIEGYLVSGPNYLRPSQIGLLAFFTSIAESTKKSVMLYNIPYRTGVNIENDTMLVLAEVPNVTGVKDCCGNAEQSYDLLRRAPDNFSVLTGEDPFFYSAMVHGAVGAIVTGAHILVEHHLKIMGEISNGDQRSALGTWNRIAHIPRLLFAEPNPAPLKYWLNRKGLIDSYEVRSPFLPVSEELASKLDELG